MRHWTCRQLLMTIALLAATGLAIMDVEFREDYGEMVTFVLGGYFGQQLPQSGDRQL